MRRRRPRSGRRWRPRGRERGTARRGGGRGCARARSQGDARAQASLGLLLESGRGVVAERRRGGALGTALRRSRDSRSRRAISARSTPRARSADAEIAAEDRRSTEHAATDDAPAHRAFAREALRRAARRERPRGAGVEPPRGRRTGYAPAHAVLAMLMEAGRGGAPADPRRRCACRSWPRKPVTCRRSSSSRALRGRRAASRATRSEAAALARRPRPKRAIPSRRRSWPTRYASGTRRRVLRRAVGAVDPPGGRAGLRHRPVHPREHVREGRRRLPQNDDAALHWYRKSAEQGFAQAQATMAVFYLEGRGVEKDRRGGAVAAQGGRAGRADRAGALRCSRCARGRGREARSDRGVGLALAQHRRALREVARPADERVHAKQRARAEARLEELRKSSPSRRADRR